MLTVYTYSSLRRRIRAGRHRQGALRGRAAAARWNGSTSEDAGTLLARLKLEGASTKADVVLGLDTNLMAEAEATGLFAPHGVDAAGLDLPVAWTDDDLRSLRLGLVRLRL